MNEIEPVELNRLQALQYFRGKDVISVNDGQILAKVEDMLIDPGQMRVSGVVTSITGFLRPDVRAISREEIQLWGKDVVLVTHPDVIRKKGELPGLEKCLSANHHIRGRDLIGLNGDRVGELRDLLIDTQGVLAGFEISHPANALADILKTGKRGIYRLPVSAVHSFGKDVLIVDLEKIRWIEPVPAEGIAAQVVDEPVEVAEEVSGPKEVGGPQEVDPQIVGGPQIVGEEQEKVEPAEEDEAHIIDLPEDEAHREERRT